MKKVLFAVAFAAIFAVSCNKEAAPVVPGEGAPVKFTAELKYQFDTRATSSAFEVGDEIGIFAGAPIARYNVKGTIATGNAVNLASAINWQAGQTSATTFAAYYPYDADKTPANAAEHPFVIDYSLPVAQTDAAAVAAADLHIAKVANVAVGESVALPFSHAFSKISVTVTKEINAAVTKVEILGSKVAGSVDLEAQTVAVSGDAAAVTAFAGASTYDAIILPQTVAPQIRVTVTGNTTYTFSLDGSAMAFEPGKVYSTTVHISKSAAQQNEASFSAGAITDWTAVSGISFTNPEISAGDVWSVIGTVNGSAWNEDFPMTQTATGTNPEDGTWEVTITVADGADGDNTGDEFKLRWAGKYIGEGGTVQEVGGDPSWWFYDGTNLQGWQANAGNIKCKEAGTYKVTLYYPSCKLDVVKQ